MSAKRRGTSVARRARRSVSRRPRGRKGHPVLRSGVVIAYYGLWRIPTWMVGHLAQGAAHVTKLAGRNAQGLKVTAVKARGKFTTNKIDYPEDSIRCECGETVALRKLGKHWLVCADRVTHNGATTTGPVQATATRTDRPAPKSIGSRPPLPEGPTVCPGCNTDFGERHLYRQHLTTTKNWKCLHSAARIQYRLLRSQRTNPALPSKPAAAALPPAKPTTPPAGTKPTTKTGKNMQDAEGWANSSDVITQPMLASNGEQIMWWAQRAAGAVRLTDNTQSERDYLATIGEEQGMMDIHEEALQAAADYQDAMRRLHDRANALWGSVPDVDYGKGL